MRGRCSALGAKSLYSEVEFFCAAAIKLPYGFCKTNCNRTPTLSLLHSCTFGPIHFLFIISLLPLKFTGDDVANALLVCHILVLVGNLETAQTLHVLGQSDGSWWDSLVPMNCVSVMLVTKSESAFVCIQHFACTRRLIYQSPSTYLQTDICLWCHHRSMMASVFHVARDLQ